MHYKHMCAFLKVKTLFKRLTITVDAQNVSLLLLNKLHITSEDYLALFLVLTLIDVTAS
jgi:hypothetical protein